MAEELKLDLFADRLGDEFAVTVDADQPVTLELIEAEALNTAAGTPRKDSFCLIFRGPTNVHLLQGIYPIKHETLGELSLFLLPRQPDENGNYYEVIIN